MQKTQTAALQLATQGQMIQVRFATNRNQTDDDYLFGSAFRSVPPLFVTGTIDVYHRGGSPNPNWCPDRKSLRIDPIPKAATSSIPEAVVAAPSTTDGITAFVDELAQNQAKTVGSGSRDSGIVFLPGFNSTFLNTMSCSAQIASAYAASKVFCFSWPSQGEFGLNPYLTDEKSAYASGSAIALALSVAFSKLRSLAKSERPLLRIVCHSMGNRALSAAIQHISVSAPEILSESYFEHAVLAAADEDDNALDEPNKLKRLLTLATNIDIYTNEFDLAMFLSSIVNLHAPLGSFGPANFGTLPNEVIWIDCTDVGNTYENDGSSDWGHQYFRNSQPVTADIHQVLQGVAPDNVEPRIPDSNFPTTKFVIPFSNSSPWARRRGYRGE
jgi:esterase/lipase superfamily enzyme